MGVGIQFGNHNMSLGKCLGELHIGSLQHSVVKIIVSVFIKVIGLRPFFNCIQLDCALYVIKGTEGLAGILVILFSGTEKSVPCGKVAVGRAGCRRETRKLTVTDIQDMSGFGDRKNDELFIDNTVGEKIRNEVGTFPICEVIVPIQKIFGSEFCGITVVAEKEVGHVKCAGCTALRFSELTSDLSCTGHELDADDDAFFLSYRFVEFRNQAVHR